MSKIDLFCFRAQSFLNLLHSQCNFIPEAVIFVRFSAFSGSFCTREDISGVWRSPPAPYFLGYEEAYSFRHYLPNYKLVLATWN